jgi:hypothetical protein
MTPGEESIARRPDGRAAVAGESVARIGAGQAGHRAARLESRLPRSARDADRRRHRAARRRARIVAAARRRRTSLHIEVARGIDLRKWSSARASRSGKGSRAGSRRAASRSSPRDVRELAWLRAQSGAIVRLRGLLGALRAADPARAGSRRHELQSQAERAAVRRARSRVRAADRQPGGDRAVERTAPFAEFLSKQVLDRELEIAREIQERLLPRDLPEFPGLRCSRAARDLERRGGRLLRPLSAARRTAGRGDRRCRRAWRRRRAGRGAGARHDARLPGSWRRPARERGARQRPARRRHLCQACT